MENNFKNNLCICITESPCCAPETLQVNYTLIKNIYIKKKKSHKVKGSTWVPLKACAPDSALPANSLTSDT